MPLSGRLLGRQNRRHTWRARIPMAESWITLRTPTERPGCRCQARLHSSEATWEDAPEHLEASNSQRGPALHSRLTEKLREKSLVMTLQRYLSFQNGPIKRPFPSRTQGACMRQKSRSPRRTIFFRLQGLLPFTREPPLALASSSSPKPTRLFEVSAIARKLVLPRRSRRDGKLLVLPCLSQDHRQRLPSEDSQSSEPIHLRGPRRAMPDQKLE